MDLDQELYRRKPKLETLATALGVSISQAGKILNEDSGIMRRHIQKFLLAHDLKVVDVGAKSLPSEVLEALLLAESILNRINRKAVACGIDPMDIENLLEANRA